MATIANIYRATTISPPGPYLPPQALSPVIRIDFADDGQDFTHWFVRDGVVIDCQPFQGRVWVGSLVLTPVTLGESLRIATRETGRELNLKHPVTAFEVLPESEAQEVVGNGRKWAERLGIPAADLGL